VTSHGKSVCDGVGCTLKRLAAIASLQKQYNDQIMIPHQLYEWAQSSIHNLSFDFLTETNTKKKRVCYQVDLQQLKLYVELNSSMHLCWLRKVYFTQKNYSASPDYTENCVIRVLKDTTELKDITGFVTCKYDNFLWLG
jgi:hypothetical protein